MYQFILSAFSDEISSDLDIQMAVLKAHQIRYMDIRGVDGRNISTYTPEEARQLRSRLDAEGISVACIGSPLGKIHITEDFAPHLVQAENLFQVANVLGTAFIRIFSFYIPQGDAPETWREEVLKRLKALSELAERYQLVLLHENEKDIYGDTPERCLDLMCNVNRENFRAVFDMANFVQCGVSPFPEAYTLLRPYIAYIHIKDAVAKDDTNVPAGQGDGKIPEILKALMDSGYQGFLTLEPHLTAFDGLAGLELHLNQKFTQGEQIDGAKAFSIAVAALQKILSDCGGKTL